MDIPPHRVARRGDRAAGWRWQRRSLLLGSGAAWVVACGSLRAIPGEALGAGAPVGREAVTSSGAVSATLLREIDFDRPSRVVNHMAWSADGERLAIGGSLDLHMGVLDVRTGRQLPAPGEQLAGVQGLAYSPDGRYLAVIRAGTGQAPDPAARYTVSLWDARTSAPVRNVVEQGRDEVVSIAAHGLSFSSDSRYLAVAYLKQLAVYAVRDSGEVERVAILPPAARCAFRPGVPVVASLSFGLGKRTCTLRQVPDGQVMARFELAGTNLGWSTDGRLLAIPNGPRIAIYEPPRGQEVRALSVADPDASFQSVSFSPDGRWLAAAAGCRVDIWQMAAWAHATTLSHRRRFISSAEFSPRGMLLAVAGDAPVAIWNVQ